MNICRTCGQVVKLAKKRTLKNKDTMRLIRIMEKHDLSIAEMQDIIGVHKQTLMRWLSLDEGKIKPSVFELLELKGYK